MGGLCIVRFSPYIPLALSWLLAIEVCSFYSSNLCGRAT
jgi:hypothetical protein